MRSLLTAVIIVFGSAAAQAQDDTWKASSETAIAVTGDITIGTDRIIFANGESLKLVPVADSDGVFKADPPANPVLLNGNRLCSRDVTYVVLAHGAGNALHMKVFEGPDAPLEAIADALPQAGTCATYEFKR